MGNWRLPLEMCEAIIDAIPSSSDNATVEEQRTLCVCALTCQAWRGRAQRVLLEHPQLNSRRAVLLFVASIRRTKYQLASLVRTLALEGLQLKSIYSLLVESFPGLSALHLYGTALEVHSKILRTRFPFFAALSTLTLQHVRFNTPRALLNLVWACPNISVLKLLYPNTKGMSVSPASAALLVSTCAHLRVCRKLVSLRLELTVTAGVEILSLPGGVFGSALTELFLQYTPIPLSTLSWFSSDAPVAVNLSTFLGDTFSSLHTLKVQSGPTIEPERTFLALSTLAKGLVSRESIKTVVLEFDHIKHAHLDVGAPWFRRRRTAGHTEKARVSPYVESLRTLFPCLQILRVELVCMLERRTAGAWVDYVVSELNTKTNPPFLEVVDCKGNRLYPSNV
ncbi:hypothetical protein C8Q78DRAFT_359793 [Trametes maxima]|nr:hypothetical protein C8Q78DRAFT_359793 [Trametes maxima]